MLTRFYADNFRGLVNFELKLDWLNLFMGPRWKWEELRFSVLRRVQKFLAGESRIQNVFQSKNLTRWRDDLVQRFELDIHVEDYRLKYSLIVEHSQTRDKVRVNEEILMEGDQPLFLYDGSEVRLFNDNFTPGPTYPYAWSLPAMGVIQETKDNKKQLTLFSKRDSKHGDRWFFALE